MVTGEAFVPSPEPMRRALELARELTGEDAGAKVLPGFGEMTFSSYPQQAEALLAARERLNQLIEASL